MIIEPMKYGAIRKKIGMGRMNRYFKILGPLIIGISAVIPIVSCRSVDTPLTPSERYSIKGDSTFRNIYRDDDFASENEIL
jgi:hypothetical protein